MNILWNSEFTLAYPSWEEKGKIEREVIKGSYRDAIWKARELSLKSTPPERGRRREVLIYLDDCFLKGIG